jgi:hypothetical protein
VPLIDPNEPLTVDERRTFGVDAKRHPITGIPLERGSGALPAAAQARLHLRSIWQIVEREAKQIFLADGIAADKAAEAARTEAQAVVNDMTRRLAIFEQSGVVSPAKITGQL